MTTITETVLTPGDAPLSRGTVKIDVVGTNADPVTAFRPDGTIVHELDLALDSNGAWARDLDPTSVLQPSGVLYRRRINIDGIPAATDIFDAPASGTFQLGDVLETPPGALPSASPSNEVDVAEEVTSDITGLATGGVLQLIAVPGIVVTVPDLARPVWIMAQAVLDFDNAPASIACAIAAPGSSALGQQIAFAGGVTNIDTDLVSQTAWALLPAHSPGDRQMFVWASIGGSIDVRVANVSPARIAVLAV